MQDGEDSTAPQEVDRRQRRVLPTDPDSLVIKPQTPPTAAQFYIATDGVALSTRADVLLGFGIGVASKR